MALSTTSCCILRGCGLWLLAAALATVSQAVVWPLQNFTEVTDAELHLASSSPRRAAEKELPVCVQGQAMPRLYILGAPKCGTSSMASDLVGAGAVFMLPGIKESHFLECACGVINGVNNVNMTGCPATDEGKEQALKCVYKRSCSERTGTLLEATTPNLALPGLPTLLSGLYADQARRVGFVVLYREPLARLHSHWWMVFHLWGNSGNSISSTLVDSFDSYLSIQDHRLQLYQAQGYEGLAEDRSMLYVYQSLYSLHLPAWLQNFAADQLVILPMMYYFNSTQSRDAVINLLSSRFGATLSVADLNGKEVAEKLVGYHPDLLDEVNTTTVAHWYAEYFRPDLRQFAGVLAEYVPSGLFVGGYAGQGGRSAAAATEMLAYLCQAFDCLG